MKLPKTRPRPTNPRAGLGRSILALAIPALGALIAEPLFLLADTAIIGHLGINELAGAGLGTTVLQTAVGLMVFLAYSTTPAVARAIGAGQTGKAMAAGRDGIWLALGLGAVLALVGFFGARPLAAAMGAQGPVLEFAVDYIQYSTFGIPAMLLVLAATGVLRGMQDTKTPLYVAGIRVRREHRPELHPGVPAEHVRGRRGPGHLDRPVGHGRWCTCGCWFRGSARPDSRWPRTVAAC